MKGWRQVTQTVHEDGGTILLQLWHVGWISHPHCLDGQQPVSASAVAAPGHVGLLRLIQPYPVPRALKTQELPGVVEAYRRGAENAQRAGFDGLEIHGANGYLPDQFLHVTSNQRTDEWGGSIENRARLHLAATDAAISVWGADCGAMHLAPRGDAHGMDREEAAEQFDYLARELGQRKIASTCARESLDGPRLGPAIKRAFGGVFVTNEGFTLESANAVLAGEADAIALGVPFIANPDLPARLAAGAEPNHASKATFYGPDARGYTDYPQLAA